MSAVLNRQFEKNLIITVTVGIIVRSDRKHGMLGSPYMLGNTALGVITLFCIYLPFLY
jgi:hypothetical protein